MAAPRAQFSYGEGRESAVDAGRGSSDCLRDSFVGTETHLLADGFEGFGRALTHQISQESVAVAILAGIRCESESRSLTLPKPRGFGMTLPRQGRSWTGFQQSQ